MGLSCFSVDFEKEVLPVLKNKCFKCHQEPRKENGKLVKPKAGVRLDSAKLIMRGSSDGKVLIPGKPDRSSLYTLAALPKDDDDIMPPKGDTLTKSELKTLKQWIEEGAKFGSWKGNDSGADPDAVKKVVRRNNSNYLTVLKSAEKKSKKASFSTIKKLMEKGFSVYRLNSKSNLYRVEFTSIKGKITDKELKELSSFARNISHLDLSKTKITNSGMKYIKSMSNLVRLNLNSTEIDDKGIKYLEDLKYLTYLNLYGTKVTDRSIKSISKIKNLEAVYLWNTKVTAKGSGSLKRSLPNCKVVTE